MADTPLPAVGGARTRAQTIVALLREELGALGIPEQELRNILPTADITGRELVRLGTIGVDSADRLLAKLYELRVARPRP